MKILLILIIIMGLSISIYSQDSSGHHSMSQLYMRDDTGKVVIDVDANGNFHIYDSMIAIKCLVRELLSNIKINSYSPYFYPHVPTYNYGACPIMDTLLLSDGSFYINRKAIVLLHE